MSRKASNFKIGLFVTLGIMLGVSAIIWVGASQYFKKTKTYVTYFDESVQGLDVDSSVKYRGVEIGRASKIRVAPDHNLIEVVVKVDFEGELERETVAQLKVIGITGIVFIELDRKAPGEPDLSPKIVFAAEYPIIPSRPSDIRRILSSVDDIMEKIKRLDTEGISNQFKSTMTSVENLLEEVVKKTQQIDSQGISDQVKSTIKAGEKLLNGPSTKKILARLESSATNLDSAIGKMDKIMVSGRLEEILVETKGTLVEARSLIAGVKDEVNAMNFAETVLKTNRLIDDLQQRTYAVTLDVKTISENLRRASESLERLLDRLNDNPSELIFSKPPPPRQ